MNSRLLIVSAVAMIAFTRGTSSARTAPPVVADRYYVDRECNRFGEVRNKALSEAANAAHRRHLNNAYRELANLCTRYRAGSLDGSAWFARSQASRSILYGFADPNNTAAADVLSLKQIPPHRYKFYSVFLLGYKATLSPDEYEPLRAPYTRFATYLGKNGVAVWLARDQFGLIDPDWTKHYCEMLGKDCDRDGPFVATSDTAPQLWKKGTPVILLRLSGLPTDDQVTLLKDLAIRLGDGKLPSQSTVALQNLLAYYKSALAQIQATVVVGPIRVVLNHADTKTVKSLEAKPRSQ